ncbi:MAG: hypothetical protein ACP5M4_03665 [Acidobacteriaceae bacterium]
MRKFFVFVCWPRGVVQRDQFTAAWVEAGQWTLLEVEVEEIVADGQQSDGLSPEQVCEEDIFSFPSEMSLAVDGSHLHVVGVFELGQACGVRAC